MLAAIETPTNCILHITFYLLLPHKIRFILAYIWTPTLAFWCMNVTQQPWWIVALWVPIIWTEGWADTLRAVWEVEFPTVHYLAVPLRLHCRYRFNTAGSSVKMSLFVCCVCVCIGVRPHVCVLSVHAHIPLCKVGRLTLTWPQRKCPLWCILYVVSSFLSIRMIWLKSWDRLHQEWATSVTVFPGLKKGETFYC